MRSVKQKALLFSALFSLTVFASQAAFAQSDPLAGIYSPTRDALTEFAVSIAGSIPKIIAATILLVIGFAAGKIVGRVVTKVTKNILQKTRQQAHDSQILEGLSDKFDSVRLISATIRWFVYLFFIVAAVNAMQFDQLTTALTNLWLWVPNLLAFVLIIVIGSIVVNFVTRWVEHQLLDHHVGSPKFITPVIKAVLYGLVFAIGFTQLGVGESIIPILVSAFSWSIAIAIGAAIAVGLGFALKDIIPASIVGASNQRSLLKVGQKVRIGEITGTVTASQLLYLIVTNEKNESTVIPTKDLMSKTIVLLN
ncbi:mechanosensitive ion channel family protein [Candidatus Nitrosotenuis chungbukensis]|uniref:mechanosensitive ion channel family protein n=1 Tax=Candidatus Nitrosotenuis chungbukensis TaxID=1353246 RepID=UPI0005B2DA8C|nr:mechanosensitive ion channel domain-containing protein [Candidatus Nitrosotenuis chungbukensis]